MKHKIRINARNEEVIQGGQRTIRERILTFLLGRKVGVHILTLGRSVESVEISEILEGGRTNANKCTG
jgi:hypothetical protein